MLQFNLIISVRGSKSIQITICGAAHSVFESEKEVAFESCTVLVDLSAEAVGQAVDEPAFVDVGKATVGATLVLQEAAETVEHLVLCEDLAFVDVVVVFLDRDQFQFESVWALAICRSDGMLAVC